MYTHREKEGPSLSRWTAQPVAATEVVRSPYPSEPGFRSHTARAKGRRDLEVELGKSLGSSGLHSLTPS